MKDGTESFGGVARDTVRGRVQGDVQLYAKLSLVLGLVLVFPAGWLLLRHLEDLARYWRYGRHTGMFEALAPVLPFVVLVAAGLISGGALFCSTVEKVRQAGYADRTLQHAAGALLLLVYGAWLAWLAQGYARGESLAFAVCFTMPFLVARYAAASRLLAAWAREAGLG